MKRPLIARLAKSKLFVPLLAGGMALQLNLGGCDPEVRDAVLTGFSTSLTSLATAIINAFFMSLQAGASTSQPVVQAAFDTLAGILV